MQFIPEIPIESILNVYHPSPATLQLETEKKHDFKLEIMKWVRTQPDPLNVMCLFPVINTAQGDPERLKLPAVNCAEVHAYLPTDLPLPLTIHIIPEGYYWKRSATTHWPDRVQDVSKYLNSWKRLYAEQYLQDYIENYGFKEPSSSTQVASPDGADDSAKPKAEDSEKPTTEDSEKLTTEDSEQPTTEDLEESEEDTAEDITDLPKSTTEVLSDLQPNLDDLNKMVELYKPYVRKLVLTNLIPLVPEGEKVKKGKFYDHLKLDVFISLMENLEELELKYRYDPRYSKLHLCLSTSDVAALGHGLASTDHVVVLRLHHIMLHTVILESFFKAIAKVSSNVSLKVLDFSSCQINSHGVIVLSKHLHCFPHLNELILHNNDIGTSGLSFLGNTLGEVKLPLEKLDLSRNPFGDTAMCDLLCNLVLSPFITELDFSDCWLTDKSIWKIRSFLVLNRKLKTLVLRNNVFGPTLDKYFLKGLIPNTCIRHLDTSNCKVQADIETLTNIFLQLNHFEVPTP